MKWENLSSSGRGILWPALFCAELEKNPVIKKVALVMPNFVKGLAFRHVNHVLYLSKV